MFIFPLYRLPHFWLFELPVQLCVAYFVQITSDFPHLIGFPLCGEKFILNTTGFPLLQYHLDLVQYFFLSHLSSYYYFFNNLHLIFFKFIYIMFLHNVLCNPKRFLQICLRQILQWSMTADPLPENSCHTNSSFEDDALTINKTIHFRSTSFNYFNASQMLITNKVHIQKVIKKE